MIIHTFLSLFLDVHGYIIIQKRKKRKRLRFSPRCCCFSYCFCFVLSFYTTNKPTITYIVLSGCDWGGKLFWKKNRVTIEVWKENYEPNNKCIGYGIGETFATSLIFFYVYRPSMYYQTWDLRLWQILKIKWQSDNCSYHFAPDDVADVFLPKFSKFFNMLFFFCNFLFHTIGNKNF